MASSVIASWRVRATALAVACMSFCVHPGTAAAGAPGNTGLLIFAGTDFSAFGSFLDGGLLWSPGGLDADGFTFKALLNGGGYTYHSDGLHASVDGTLLSAAVLPGWRFTRNRVTVTLFAGPTVQNYQLTPFDPGSRLHGFYVGALVAADIWYQPSSATMIALNGAVASVGPTGSLRGAFGVRLFGQAYVGPEAQELWCGDYDEVRLGAQATVLHVGASDWAAAAGWSMTSDQRSGPYLRLGIDARY